MGEAKDLRNKIRALQARVEAHHDKIETDPGSPARSHWEKDQGMAKADCLHGAIACMPERLREGGVSERDRTLPEAARAKAQAGQTQVTSPISVPHMPPTVVWDELAEEAERYVALLRRLKRTAPDAPERDGLEHELMDSLAHLQMHSQVLEASVVKALEENTGA